MDQMIDDGLHDIPDYVLRAGVTVERNKRYLPRSKRSGPDEGQDFFTLTERHGRPIGVFEETGRKVPYRGS